MLFKLKQTFFIILSLIILNACQTRWAADSFIKPKSSKQQIQKDKEKEKRKREYQLQVEKDRERNYNRQATSTKITWDKNAERSERWRKNEFQNKSFGSRIRAFFDRFKREAKPDSDLFSKEISKRNSKKKSVQQVARENAQRKKEAQKQADDLVSVADKKADKIVAEARVKAANIKKEK